METKKVLDWIKGHKKEILITTGSIIGVGVLGYFGVKGFKNANTIMVKFDDPIIGDWRDNPVAKLDHVTITDLWDDDGYTNAIIDGFTAADMGVVGEELMANIPAIKADTVLSASFNTTTLTKMSE